MHHSKLNFSSHTTTQSVISGRVDRQQLEQLEESTMGWWWWAYLTQANTSLILMPNQFLVIFQFLFISHRQHTALSLSLSLWQSKLMMAGINARRREWNMRSWVFEVHFVRRRHIHAMAMSEEEECYSSLTQRESIVDSSAAAKNCPKSTWHSTPEWEKKTIC